ncbi:hypothetical protein [Acidaminococcus fermentans]|uniref:hypothetical protein n=1 Tax=Acidaminococcus fermentans TaxID=905 RepID=UPI00243290F3|nr:hypothetical protein [Acidaminococcus fermentans]
MKAVDAKKQEARNKKRCTGCQWASPKEFQQYDRLWPFVTCGASTGRKCVDVTVCPRRE